MEKRWFFRWLAATPGRWLGRTSAVRQNLAGGTQGLSYLRHLARGNRIRRPKELDNVDETAHPVLLIHGFLGNRGCMYALEKRLIDDGFCVFSFNLGRVNIRDIRGSALLIHRKVERILAQTQWEKIDIIAHSMGGLIGLYYIKKLGGHKRVGRLITLGTPFRGTWRALAGIATMGLFSNATWQLLPRSRLLHEIDQSPLPEGVEIVSLAAVRDRLCPPSATRVPGVKAITVPFGHSGLVVSREVYKRLQNILRRSQHANDEESQANAGTDRDSELSVVSADDEPPVLRAASGGGRAID